MIDVEVSVGGEGSRVGWRRKEIEMMQGKLSKFISS